jgi:hypothetical protein
MDSAKLNDWMQVIGIFALVASLIFVGLQMKQTQEIALADQYQARAESTMDFYLMNMETSQGQMAVFPPSADEMTRADFGYYVMATNYFWMKYDNHHFQYTSGFLDKETWEGLEGRIKAQWEYCELRWVYEENHREGFRESFNSYLSSLDDPCRPEDRIRPDWINKLTESD